MGKIKSILDFERTIKTDTLAITNTSEKFMLKSYLNMLLNGGKIRNNCCLYAVGKIDKDTSFCLSEGDKPLNMDGCDNNMRERIIKKKKEEIIRLFRKLRTEKKWITEEIIVDEFDENGKKIIPYSTIEKEQPIISKKVTTIIKTEYFLDESLDIGLFKIKK